MSKNELNVEDLVFNEDRSESDYLELPLSRQTFLLVAGAVVLVGALALGRAGFLNVFRGEFYSTRADMNVNKEIALPAPRGIITDRFGNPLVENKSSFTALLNVAELLKDRGRVDGLIEEVTGILNLDQATLRATVSRADVERGSFVAIARNISPNQAIQIKDLNLPYLQASDDYTRDYIGGPAFSHALGYVSAEDYYRNLQGKSGLEAQYDQFLDGQDGRLIVYRDAMGKPLDTKVAEPPVSGQKLVTTLDADFQSYFYERMRSGLSALGRDTGVGLAVDPRNGEVLALISFPSFDNNQVAKYLTKPSQPLFNRAISGVYTPGSTIKPLVALAALKENLMDPEFQILSTGSIEIPNPYDPEKPSRFLDWKAHGWVDLHSALARSSNVYFYELGGGFEGFKGLGIDRLNDYWQKFLLGQKTGIDLPAEE